MKRLVFLALLAMTTVATIIAGAGPPPVPVPPAAGCVYGGSRNVGECHVAVASKCNPWSTDTWDWVYDASCDIWCCPGVPVYMHNNCGTFNPASPKACCDSTVTTERWIRSINPPACTP